MTSHVWSFCSSWIGSHTRKVSPQSVQPLQRRRFLKVFKKNSKTIWLPNHVTDDIINSFSVAYFIPRWSSKFFILIRCSVLHMQLWCHNEGTYDIIQNHTHSSWSTCYMPSFNFYLGAVSEIQRSKSFPFFQHGCHTTWPMMSYLSIEHSTWVVTPVVKMSQSDERLRRKTQVLCRQTNKRTSKGN